MSPDKMIAEKNEQSNLQNPQPVPDEWWQGLSIHEYWEICVTHDPNSEEFSEDYSNQL